jgi:hypothetical protein
MSVIENFSAISAEERLAFAEALVKTVNSENIFTSDTNFKVLEVDADETTGDLYIILETDDLVLVERDATWSCGDEEEAYEDPGYDADYAQSVFDDAKKAFKTLKTEIDGYDIELSIDDVDEEETDEVIVETCRDEDAGIGSYEYWGHMEYDSQPYVEVEGTIVKACNLSLSLIVGAAAQVEEPAPEQPE